jgi:hypothetical protein
MSITLTITDAADGTGGTATIAGSDAGSANTLHFAAFTGAVGTPAWVPAGARTGDGTIPVAPGNGYYLWYAGGLAGGSPALSNVAYQNLSDASQSVHYRCLLATQAVFQALALVPPEQVLVFQRPVFFDPGSRPDAYTLPIVLISPTGREGLAGSLTGRDDVVYPVAVSITDRKLGAYEADLARDLLWRQKISRAFRNQRLAGVPEVITAGVVPDWILDPGVLAQARLWKSGFLINFTSREPRGIA